MRAGCACYTTHEEVERLIEGVASWPDDGPPGLCVVAFAVVALAPCVPRLPPGRRRRPRRCTTSTGPDGLHRALDDPARDAYQKPDEVMKALALREGEIAGRHRLRLGDFTLRFARAVGDTGRVYAVDIGPDMIRHLNRRLRDDGVRQRRPRPRGSGRPAAAGRLGRPLRDRRHLAPRRGPGEEPRLLRRMLKPGGQVVHIDFHSATCPSVRPSGMKIAREDLVKQMEATGSASPPSTRFLPYQYFLVFAVREPPGRCALLLLWLLVAAEAPGQAAVRPDELPTASPPTARDHAAALREIRPWPPGVVRAALADLRRRSR